MSHAQGMAGRRAHSGREAARSRIIGEHQLQARAKRGRVAMTVCIASDTALVSYRIRERPLVPLKIHVKSASRVRAPRHPADRRKTFREVLNTCFYLLIAA